MIDAKEYQKLKDKAAEVKTQIDRAQGTLATLMKSLKDEFECDTIEAAELKLEKMKTELAESEKAYNDEMAKFKEKYGDLLK